MKTNAILFSRISLGLTIVLIICFFLDFLALHDINNDYVSKLVMNRFASSTSLPDWTNTTVEWSIVQLSFLVKIIVTGFLIFFLFALRKNIKRETTN
jgi:hypothetical protein